MKQFYALCLSVLFAATAYGQKKGTDNAIEPVTTDAGMLQSMMENYHCCPRQRDEQYCKDIAYLFVKSLDPLHIYFTKDDIATLNNYKLIADAFNGANHDYVLAATELYKNRLSSAKQYIEEIVKSPFNMNHPETMILNPDSAGWATDATALKARMATLLKFVTLDRLTEGALSDSTLADKPWAEREPKEREIAGKVCLRRINNRLQSKLGFENLVVILFNDALAKANDPHSEFIPDVVKKRSLAAQRYGGAASFGLKLKENYKGDVVVYGIIPNSSAWKSGMVNVDDILVSVQYEQEPVVDMEGADIEDVDLFFSEKRYKKLKVTFRKTDGQLKTVTLVRGGFRESETGVQTFILDGPKKVAYVIMPSFYGDWDSWYGTSCARDICKDLEKVQFEVEGLIIDMRYNGGGSLSEANQIAGIFVDEGPLGFRKQRGGYSTEMRDPMLGTMYQEPVVILVNNESASATEYVAAALQDYNRAIVVGSPTFGKATAQRVLPADTTIDRVDMNNGNFTSKAKDFVKITMAKLYRVTGYNNQLRGVQPDIFLPSLFDSVHYREKSMKNALSLDTLHRKGQFEVFAPLPIDALRKKSEERVKNSKSFKLIEKGTVMIAERKKIEKKPVSLSYNDFWEMSKLHLEKPRKLIKELESDSAAGYKVSNWQFVKPEIAPTPEEEEANAKVLKNITCDIYVHEAYAIMKDWLEMKK